MIKYTKYCDKCGEPTKRFPLIEIIFGRDVPKQFDLCDRHWDSLHKWLYNE